MEWIVSLNSHLQSPSVRLSQSSDRNICLSTTILLAWSIMQFRALPHLTFVVVRETNHRKTHSWLSKRCRIKVWSILRKVSFVRQHSHRSFSYDEYTKYATKREITESCSIAVDDINIMTCIDVLQT